MAHRILYVEPVRLIAGEIFAQGTQATDDAILGLVCGGALGGELGFVLDICDEMSHNMGRPEHQDGNRAREKPSLPGAQHHAETLQQHWEKDRRQRRAAAAGLHYPHACGRGLLAAIVSRSPRRGSRSSAKHQFSSCLTLISSGCFSRCERRFWLKPTRFAIAVCVSLCRLRVETSSWPSCAAVRSRCEVGENMPNIIRNSDKFTLSGLRMKSRCRMTAKSRIAELQLNRGETPRACG